MSDSRWMDGWAHRTSRLKARAMAMTCGIARRSPASGLRWALWTIAACKTETRSAELHQIPSRFEPSAHVLAMIEAVAARERE